MHLNQTLNTLLVECRLVAAECQTWPAFSVEAQIWCGFPASALTTPRIFPRVWHHFHLLTLFFIHSLGNLTFCRDVCYR
jgi:hypothetical protein